MNVVLFAANPAVSMDSEPREFSVDRRYKRKLLNATVTLNRMSESPLDIRAYSDAAKDERQVKADTTRNMGETSLVHVPSENMAVWTADRMKIRMQTMVLMVIVSVLDDGEE